MIATERDSRTSVDTLVVRDGAALSYRCFPAPPDRERGRIIYLHGIQSHGGWYVEAAANPTLLTDFGPTDQGDRGTSSAAPLYTLERADLCRLETEVHELVAEVIESASGELRTIRRRIP